MSCYIVLVVSHSFWILSVVAMIFLFLEILDRSIATNPFIHTHAVKYGGSVCAHHWQLPFDLRLLFKKPFQSLVLEKFHSHGLVKWVEWGLGKSWSKRLCNYYKAVTRRSESLFIYMYESLKTFRCWDRWWLWCQASCFFVRAIHKLSCIIVGK